MNDKKEPFIHVYSRAQALKDGNQFDVSEVAKEVGFVYPVFLTRSVYFRYVVVPEGVECQDESGRLWDILWMLYSAIKRPSLRPQQAPGEAEREDRMEFSLMVRNDNHAPKLVTLLSVCGPNDIDDPRPAITVMLHSDD